MPKSLAIAPAGEPWSWQYRLVAFIFHSGALPSDLRDQLGAITLAMLKNNRNHFPRFAYSAHIDADGNLLADYASGPAPSQREARKLVGHVEVVNAAMRHLADAIKLDDADRIDMFDTLRAWIATDARATKNIREEIPGYQPPGE
jgi:hypothetical protein